MIDYPSYDMNSRNKMKKMYCEDYYNKLGNHS